MKKLLFFVLLLPILVFSQPFAENSSYEVCFTPGQNCTGLIIKAIEGAKESILVQAYAFTSAPIAKALVEAKKRGVEVKVILDKSQRKSNRYVSSTFLINQGIPVWIDHKPAIAHNKIIIIDSSQVITGSFNFTKAAQEKNAENLLIINDVSVAELYIKNWNNRAHQSTLQAKY